MTAAIRWHLLGCSNPVPSGCLAVQIDPLIQDGPGYGGTGEPITSCRGGAGYLRAAVDFRIRERARRAVNVALKLNFVVGQKSARYSPTADLQPLSNPY